MGTLLRIKVTSDSSFPSVVGVRGDKSGYVRGFFGYGDIRADKAIVFTMVRLEPWVNKTYLATLYGILRC